MELATQRRIDIFLQSPELRAAEQRRAKEVAAERAQISAERLKLDVEAENRFHAFESEQSVANAERVKAMAVLKAKNQTCAEITARRISMSFSHAARIERIEASLRETSDPAIAESIEEMRDEWEKARRSPPADERKVVTNVNTGKKTMVAGRPIVTPAHRMRAIRDAIAEAEALKLVADQSNVPARLEEIRKSIPAIGAAL